jgi:hypothetical protein
LRESEPMTRSFNWRVLDTNLTWHRVSVELYAWEFEEEFGEKGPMFPEREYRDYLHQDVFS